MVMFIDSENRGFLPFNTCIEYSNRAVNCSISTD